MKRTTFGRPERAKTIERVAQPVDHATKQTVPHRKRGGGGTRDDAVTRTDPGGAAEGHRQQTPVLEPDHLESEVTATAADGDLAQVADAGPWALRLDEQAYRPDDTAGDRQQIGLVQPLEVPLQRKLLRHARCRGLTRPSALFRCVQETSATDVTRRQATPRPALPSGQRSPHLRQAPWRSPRTAPRPPPRQPRNRTR